MSPREHLYDGCFVAQGPGYESGTGFILYLVCSQNLFREGTILGDVWSHVWACLRLSWAHQRLRLKVKIKGEKKGFEKSEALREERPQDYCKGSHASHHDVLMPDRRRTPLRHNFFGNQG